MNASKAPFPTAAGGLVDRVLLLRDGRWSWTDVTGADARLGDRCAAVVGSRRWWSVTTARHERSYRDGPIAPLANALGHRRDEHRRAVTNALGNRRGRNLSRPASAPASTAYSTATPSTSSGGRRRHRTHKARVPQRRLGYGRQLLPNVPEPPRRPQSPRRRSGDAAAHGDRATSP